MGRYEPVSDSDLSKAAYTDALQKLAMNNAELSTRYNPGEDINFADTPELLRWEIDVESELNSLRHVWNGEIKNDSGQWVLPMNGQVMKPIMNQKGIQRMYSLLSTVATKSAVLNNYSLEESRNLIRVNCWDAWETLMRSMDDFGLDNNCFKIVYGDCRNLIYICFNRAEGGGERNYRRPQTRRVENVHHTNMQSQGNTLGSRLGFFGGNR